MQKNCDIQIVFVVLYVDKKKMICVYTVYVYF